jgi:hypothetical protein
MGLVKAALAHYPTLLFTPSSVADELPNFDPEDVRQVLREQSISGLLSPQIQYRCIECDSPIRDGRRDEVSTSAYCTTCEENNECEELIYFGASDSLSRQISGRGEESDTKKEQATPDEIVDRIRIRTSSPKDSDRLTDMDISKLAPFFEGIERSMRQTEQHAARTAAATEAAVPHAQSTAEATNRFANDPRPVRVGVIAAWLTGVAIVVAILVAAVTELHGFTWVRDRMAGLYPGAAAPTRSPSPPPPRHGKPPGHRLKA